MFDEITSGLDTELKNAVIKTIRDNINTTAFIVEYEGIEGIFDHVINVDELHK